MTNNLIDVSFYFLTFSCSFYFDAIFRSHYLYICLSSSIWHVNSFVEVFFSSTRSQGEKFPFKLPYYCVIYLNRSYNINISGIRLCFLCMLNRYRNVG